MPKKARKKDGKNRRPKRPPPLMTLDHFENSLDHEIEDENFDVAIDSIWLDLLGVYLDCAAIKDNFFARGVFSAESKDDPALVFEEIGSPLVRVQKNRRQLLVDEKLDCWNEMMRNTRDAQAPLKLCTELCQKIRSLPERRDVTLYIRLDEEVPHNSCTAYEVDWDAYQEGATENLFTIFRLCSRPKQASRTELIVGTLASACLHPYTIIASPMTDPDRHGNGESQNGNAPFRPRRLLLDRPEDMLTAELQYYLNRMGLSECVEVSSKLRSLHDVADMDFFPKEQGDLFMIPSVASVL